MAKHKRPDRIAEIIGWVALIMGVAVWIAALLLYPHH